MLSERVSHFDELAANDVKGLKSELIGRCCRNRFHLFDDAVEEFYLLLLLLFLESLVLLAQNLVLPLHGCKVLVPKLNISLECTVEVFLVQERKVPLVALEGLDE